MIVKERKADESQIDKTISSPQVKDPDERLLSHFLYVLVARASRRATISAKNQLHRSKTRQMATINGSVLLPVPPHMGGRGRGRP